MSDESGTGSKVGKIVLWVMTVVAGVLMTFAGASKFLSSESWIELFVGWGYPAWFVYVVGTLEVVGALMFFVPRFATWAAALIVVIMGSAVFTVVTNPGEMGPMVPLINVIAFSVVGYLRRGERWMPGGATQHVSPPRRM